MTADRERHTSCRHPGPGRRRRNGAGTHEATRLRRLPQRRGPLMKAHAPPPAIVAPNRRPEGMLRLGVWQAPPHRPACHEHRTAAQFPHRQVLYRPLVDRTAGMLGRECLYDRSLVVDSARSAELQEVVGELLRQRLPGPPDGWIHQAKFKVRQQGSKVIGYRHLNLTYCGRRDGGWVPDRRCSAVRDDGWKRKAGAIPASPVPGRSVPPPPATPPRRCR